MRRSDEACRRRVGGVRCGRGVPDGSSKYLDMEQLKRLSHAKRSAYVEKLALFVMLDLLLCCALHLM